MTQLKIAHSLSIAVLLSIYGCSNTPNWVATGGPSRSIIETGAKAPNTIVHLVDITGAVTQRLQLAEQSTSLAQRLGDAPLTDTSIIGAGDTLDVAIWEAPPALLFGAGSGLSAGVIGASSMNAQGSSFPSQMVASDGTIQIPFAGTIQAAGRTAPEIQREIESRLVRKANKPQALVRVQKNATSTVTVVGEVAQNTKLPLTAKGERLLDALAAAGGSRQPIEKVMVQVTRDSQVVSMPLDKVVKDPRQNIILAAGDVVTVTYQPKSFTILGAAGRNAEINFESIGVSLAQALGRAGGLQADRSDAYGVFVFRYEDPRILGNVPANIPRGADGRVPVVYRANLKDPLAFLNIQAFPMHDKDIVYIADAPSVDMQKFLGILSSSMGIVSSSIYSINNIGTIGQ
jgi:polysaccharide export outer membrane protein